MLRKPKEWEDELNITVLDSEGWRSYFNLPPKSMEEPINRDEFEERANGSMAMRLRPDDSPGIPTEREVFDALGVLLSAVRGQEFEPDTWYYRHRGPQLDVIFDYGENSLNVNVVTPRTGPWAYRDTQARIAAMLLKWQLVAFGPNLPTCTADYRMTWGFKFPKLNPADWSDTRFIVRIKD